MTLHIGRSGLALIGVLAAGALALALVAGVPVGNLLWFGLVVACPLLMLFMHGGPRHEAHSSSEEVGNAEYPRGVH